MQESDELYLLSAESDASVKVRDDLMDVKRLEAVDGDGLEQWRPVLKGSFPLGAADVRVVVGALGVPSPELAREAYTLEQMVDEIVEPTPALVAVAVHKRRVHYPLGDCMVELSEVTAEAPVGADARRRVRGPRAGRRRPSASCSSQTGRTSASHEGSRRCSASIPSASP